MVLENLKYNNRQSRLGSPDDDIFRDAYKEMLESVKFAWKYFRNTAIYPCLNKGIGRYTKRYQKLISKSN